MKRTTAVRDDRGRTTGRFFAGRVISGGRTGDGRVLERSRLHRVFDGIGKVFAYTSARSYGSALLVFGLTTVLLYFGTTQLNSFFLSDPVSAVVGLVCALVGIPLLLSDMPLCLLSQESALFSFVFFDFFCLRKRYRSEEVPGIRTYLSVIFGFVLAFVGFFTETYYVPLAVGGIFLVWMSFSSPEMPFFLTLLAFPALPLLPHPTLALCALLLLSLLSFIRKAALGNRVFHLTPYDVTFFLFGLSVLIAGLVSGTSQQAAVFALLLCSCPLAGNLLVNRRLTDCALGAVAVSSVPLSVYAVCQAAFGIDNGNWTDAAFEGVITDRVTGTFGNPNILAVYLLVAVMFSLALCAEKKQPAKKFFYGATALLSLAALVLTWSRGAWIALAVGLVFGFVFAGLHRPGITLAVLCALPYGLFFLPSAVLKRLGSVLSLSDSSIVYRLSVYRSSLRMARDSLLFGVGIGPDAFSEAFADYAEAGVTSPHSHNLLLEILSEAGMFALLFFLALFVLRVFHLSAYRKYLRRSTVRLPAVAATAALLSLLVFGAADYPFSNMSMLWLFFAVFGIGAATLRIAKNEYDDRSYSDEAGHSAEEASVDIEVSDN